MAAPDLVEFYRRHRGGTGPVIIVLAIEYGTMAERRGVFSCLEKAESWRHSLGDGYTCVYSPYIVDVPEYGNRRDG